MTELVPPEPPLVGERVELRPFRISDAAAVALSCSDSEIPKFTMMTEGLTEEQATRWIETGLEWPP